MRRRASRPQRSLTRTALEAIVFVAAAALVLFIIRAFDRAYVEVPEAAKAIDGDSLRQGDREIRLYGIDAPEYLQRCRDHENREWPCGREAAAFLRRILNGKTVSCTATDTDRYGRLVAICEAGGQSLNGEIVRQGWAVAYRRHSRAYVEIEAEARRAKRGIWVGPFDDPEKWRERERLTRGGLAENGD